MWSGVEGGARANGLQGKKRKSDAYKGVIVYVEVYDSILSIVCNPQKMMRVRQALGDDVLRRKLRGKIPKEVMAGIPVEAAKSPTTLIKALPEGDAYRLLGVITEVLIEKGCDDWVGLVKKVAGVELEANVLKAETTKRWLEGIEKVRGRVLELCGGGMIRSNERVSREGCGIEGHPDLICGEHVFEIKTSGKVKSEWSGFLMQLFCYTALVPTARWAHMVLPLQGVVCSFELGGWVKRDAYFKEMCEYAKGKGERDEEEDDMFAPLMFNQFPIGAHIEKKKSVRATLQGIDDSDRPYQVFFSNRGVAFKVEDDDVKASLEVIRERSMKMFVHSPYLLNLCMEPAEDSYVVDCLKRHLRVAGSMGFKGVVVHVGKLVGRSLEVGLEHMRKNIDACLEAATAECPLLLETPAGQGSEVLTAAGDFIEFCNSIKHDGFGVCVDTCHTFASGTRPLEYLKRILGDEECKKKLKLIHFNDSKTAFQSKVDRHALLGTGHIDKDELVECALLAFENKVPMLVE